MEQTTTEAIVEIKGGKRLRSGGKAPLIIVGAVLAVLLAAYIGLCAYAAGRDTFQPNRRINGIDVGGLTVDQAQETLETSLLSQEITLTDPDTGTQAVITVADLGYTADEFAGDARFWMDTDRQMGFFRKGWAYIAYATGRWSGGANWPDMDRAALRETVTRLSGDLSREPLDGSWELAENAVVFTKARDGRTLDAAALETALADVAAYSETGYQVPFSFTAVPARVLTAREQELIRLHYAEGQSLTAIAARQGRAVSSVSRSLRGARDKLYRFTEEAGRIGQLCSAARQQRL